MQSCTHVLEGVTVNRESRARAFRDPLFWFASPSRAILDGILPGFSRESPALVLVSDACDTVLAKRLEKGRSFLLLIGPAHQSLDESLAVGRAIALCGLSLAGLERRRQKPIACPGLSDPL